MNLCIIIFISISISMILYYIYETDFIWEYLNKLASILNYKFFNQIFYGLLLLKAYPTSNESNYLQFINKTYNTFTTRLISCPICFGFWLCVIFSMFSKITLIPIFGFISLTCYYLIKILTKLSAKI